MENRVFDFSKKICALMDNIEYLILYPSFLDKLDKITELKNEKKDLERAQISSELTSREFDKLKLKYDKNNEILKKFKKRVKENEDKEKRNKLIPFKTDKKFIF